MLTAKSQLVIEPPSRGAIFHQVPYTPSTFREPEKHFILELLGYRNVSFAATKGWHRILFTCKLKLIWNVRFGDTTPNASIKPSYITATIPLYFCHSAPKTRKPV